MARSKSSHIVRPIEDVMLNATKIWAPQPGPQLLATLCPARMILFGGARGGGKMLANESKILTPKGWITHGEARVGQVITDPETGGSQRIVGVYPQGELDLYRVTFDDGASVLAGLEHLWLYKLPNRKRPRSNPSGQRDFLKLAFKKDYSATGRYANFKVGTTEDMKGALDVGVSARIPLTAPVLFDVNGRTGSTVLDPYLIGQMLGDGAFRSGKTPGSGFLMTTEDEETAEYLKEFGFRRSGSSGISWYLGQDGDYEVWSALRSWASNHGLLGKSGKDKRIPDYIFTANVKYRLAVLQGLLDSDGSVDDRGHIEFSNISDSLCFGVADLVRSFGGKATVSDPIIGQYRGKNGEVVECQKYRRVYIWSDNASAFFRLTRKKERCTDSWNGGYENMRKVISIEFSHRGYATCIRVSSPNGLYVTDDYIVTHNTDCAIGKQIYGALRYGSDWNGLFIRKSYKYFADIRRRLNQLIRAGLPAELVGPQQGTNYLRFTNGAIVTLTVVESIEKAEFFQGQSFTSVSIEEACQFSYIEQMIEMLKGCLRSAAGVPTQMFLTANPGGPGHSQVKARFMPRGVKPGQIQVDSGGMTMVFIPSNVEDNKILCENDPDYVNNLRSIKDPALRKAWLEGDWDVVLGGFFGDVWNPFRHVVPSFRPPSHWPRIVGMDWGSATPFSIGWYAVADGETSVALRGEHRIFPKGALIRFHEWYGVKRNVLNSRIEANVGIRLQSSDVGVRMLELESRHALLGRTTQIDRVADPSIFAEKDGPSIAEKFTDVGVVWRRGENKRISGWDSVRLLLHGRLVKQTWKDLELEDGTVEQVVDEEEREPLLYFTENCEHMIRTLPEQERSMTDFEDIDTDGEDHACLALDTEVFFNGGRTTLKEIFGKKGQVMALDGYPDVSAGAEITRLKARVVRLVMEDGESVVCTPDHKFFSRDGWKRCDTLSSTDELRYVDVNSQRVMSEYGNFKNLMHGKSLYWKRVARVESVDERIDVGCLYVPWTHSFTLASGLVSKNCDELRYVATSRPTSSIRLSEAIRPAVLSECALDIKLAVEGRGGLHLPDDGLTRPQGGGTGGWDDFLGGTNVHVAR